MQLFDSKEIDYLLQCAAFLVLTVKIRIACHCSLPLGGTTARMWEAEYLPKVGMKEGSGEN